MRCGRTTNLVIMTLRRRRTTSREVFMAPIAHGGDGIVVIDRKRSACCMRRL